MKKTLLASAIAAATLSGTAFAEGHESNMPTVYGNIQYVVTYTDVEDVAGVSGISHDDNGSTLGVMHDHEIAPGVTGFFKVELEGINADNKDAEGDNAGLNELDEAYIGIRGDSFGQVWVGSDDSQFESLVGGVGEYYEVAGLNTFADYETGEGDLIQYVSPSFGGLTLHGAVAIQGDNDSEYGGKAYPYQLGAQYSIDMLTLSVAMDSNDGASASNENTYGVQAAAALTSDLTVGAIYTTRGGVGDGTVAGTEGLDNAQVYARYNMGANVFAISYEMAEEDKTDNEASVLTIQALHNVSDHIYVYTEGYLRTDDDGTSETDTTQLNVGAVYYF